MTTTTERCISVSRRSRRPDLYVHALAQLPDDVTLELPEHLPDSPALQLLAEAYGIADRVRFTPTPVTAPAPSIGTMADLVEGLALPGDPPAACRADDRALSGHRVAIVTNVPAPYRLPLFAEMDSRLRASGACLRVFFLGASDPGRPWIHMGVDTLFDHEVVTSVGLPLRRRRQHVPLALERRLAAFRPSIVLCGGFSPLVSGRVAAYARRTRAILGLWSGETASRAASAGRLRSAYRNWLVKEARFGIAYGFLSAEYLRTLAPTLPLVYGRNTSPVSASVVVERRCSEVVELLTVADLSSVGKQVDLLIDAVRLTPEVRCRLTVVGSGALLPMLRERARRDNRVNFAGALSPDEVRERFAVADVFLFASKIDIFGLVLVEAMGSGVAPVTSSAPGAVADLAVNEHNCLVVDENHPEAWAEAIRRISHDNGLRRLLADSAKATIERRWTIPHAADAMIAGLRLAVLQGERR